MSQHSTHSFADKDSRPPSSLSYYSTYSSDEPQSQSPDPEADEHPLHKAQSPSNVDSTSFLGSVWNLVKDAKDLAAKELDRLLDNFPFKHQANAQEDIGDHSLRVRKRNVSATTGQPAKSMLGHGPHAANRLAIAKKRTLAKRLLIKDAKNRLQDLSTMGNVIDTSSRVSPVEESRSFVHFHRSNSMPIIPRKRYAPSYPSHPSPMLSASVRSPTISYRATLPEESDGWESPRTNKDEESDASEFQLGRQQKRRSRIESRANSETSSVVSLSAMSISENSLHHHRHQPHHHSRHLSQHKRQHINHGSRALDFLHRDRQHASELEHEPGHDIPKTRTHHQTAGAVMDPQSIYPRSNSRRGSISGSDDRLSPGQTLASNSYNRPSTSGRSSPYSPVDISEDPSRPPSQASVSSPSAVENERFDKLQQELAAIKEQLASLVSARNEDMQRATQYPVSPPPPPPPPSFSLSTQGLISAKKWSIPQNEATVSMQKVLNELSSSTLRLRKTGSPFLKESKAKTTTVTEVADAMDTTSTSKTSGTETLPYPKTPTRIHRPQDTKLATKSLSSLSSLPSITSTPKSKDLSIMPSEDVDLRWPSPGTIQRADAKLDTAAAAMNNRSSLNSGTNSEQSVITGEPGEIEVERSALSSASSNTDKRKLSGPASNSSTQPRSGPVMDESQKKQRPVRPVRPRSVLHRSLTDPERMTSMALEDQLPKSRSKQVSFTSSDKQVDERKWFLESDMDSWRVGN